MVDGFVGQWRATVCPICFNPDNGKWTCPECTSLVGFHREALRNLQVWRLSYVNQEAPDVLVGATGREVCLWDMIAFYEHADGLPTRMRQAIQWFLYEGQMEETVAVRMGIKPSNPIGIYATQGLTQMLQDAVRVGGIPDYHINIDDRLFYPPEPKAKPAKSEKGEAA